MKILIGERLRLLRLRKGVTQEQAAEVFGITAQAISRWENDSACPDVGLLPGLAIYYNTTVDSIVGMDEIRSEQALCEIHTEINRLVVAGRTAEAVEYIRECLKLYPGDSGLMMSLGETLAHRSDDPKACEEAIRIAERVLKSDDVSMKAKGTTTANLLFLYLKAGMDDKAQALVRSMPHIWESREIMMPELYEGEAYREALKQCIVKALVFLCGKAEALSERKRGQTPEYIQLGADFTPVKTVDGMLDMLRAFLEE